MPAASTRSSRWGSAAAWTRRTSSSRRASVITPLDLEHTDVLGDTLEKIAEEKAGIIKPGVPAFVGLQPPAAKEVFPTHGAWNGAARSRSWTRRSASSPPRWTLDGHHVPCPAAARSRAEEFRLSMLGEFQAENAALAFLTLRRTMPRDPERMLHARGFSGPACPAGWRCARDRAGHRAGRRAHAAGRHAAPVIFSAVFPGEAVLLFGSVSGQEPAGDGADPRAGVLADHHLHARHLQGERPGRGCGDLPRHQPATVLEKDPARALRRAREESGGIAADPRHRFLLHDSGDREAAVSKELLEWPRPGGNGGHHAHERGRHRQRRQLGPHGRRRSGRRHPPGRRPGHPGGVPRRSQATASPVGFRPGRRWRPPPAVCPRAWSSTPWGRSGTAAQAASRRRWPPATAPAWSLPRGWARRASRFPRSPPGSTATRGSWPPRWCGRRCALGVRSTRSRPPSAGVLRPGRRARVPVRRLVSALSP